MIPQWPDGAGRIIDSMKRWIFIAIFLSCLACAAKDKPRPGPSKHDLKLAEQSFEHGTELQKDGQLDEAFQEFSKAASLAPAKLEYLTARELLRSRIAGSYIDHGNLLAEIGEVKQ